MFFEEARPGEAAPAEEVESRRASLARFAQAITPHLAELIEQDPDGPIARQFVASDAEARFAPAETADPIGDVPHSPVPGIVHREPDRVLLMPTRVCAAYCRFCFRGEMLGPEQGLLGEADLAGALAYIAAHPRIWEVILSGGDPLVLSPRRLQRVMAALNGIAHVGTIRIHTRQVVADPASITPELVAALKGAKPVWVAVHVNHADELTPPTLRALASLADAGLPLVAQTVLLRGINDDADTLDTLFRRLVENRVKPYYLHHGDMARGTAHFRTTIVEGQRLMRDLRTRLSGLALPLYMLDIPGGAGKVPVGPVYLEGDRVTDPRGGVHRYR